MSSVRYFAFTAATLKSMNEAQLIELFDSLDSKTVTTIFGAICKHTENRLKKMVTKEILPEIVETENARMNEEITRMKF